MNPQPARQPWYRILYVQVLIAVALGIAIGWRFPAFGVALEPLGIGFIKLIKMMIAPIIFCTVVPGIPVASLALLVGIDRFMSECRALTNLIGNGVATVVISRWEKEITPAQLQAALRE